MRLKICDRGFELAHDHDHVRELSRDFSEFRANLVQKWLERTALRNALLCHRVMSVLVVGSWRLLDRGGWHGSLGMIARR